MFFLLRRCRPLACALLALLITGAASAWPPPAVVHGLAFFVQPPAGGLVISVVWVSAPCEITRDGGGADAVYSLYPDREGAAPLSPCALLGGSGRRLHA